MPFTPEQHDAITARGENLLLAAAAGSGKTTVLVERVLGLIRDGVNVDDMLIVTFTRAAAADMKRRLALRIAEMAETEPRLREQLTRLDTANCSTIHSFCIEVVRAHFEIAGVDPAFQVPDAPQEAQLSNRAMQAALERAYRLNAPGFERLDYGRGPDKVGMLARALDTFMDARPEPETWLADALLRMPAGDGAAWVAELARDMRIQLAGAACILREALDQAAQPLGPTAYIPALEDDLDNMEALLAMPDEDIPRAIRDVAPKRLGSCRVKNDDPDIEARLTIQDTVKGLRARYKKMLDSARACAPDTDLELPDLREDLPMYEALYRFTLDYRARYKALKREKSLLSFSDLEHAALGVLDNPDIARNYRARFQHVFVDEYQDVSDMQEAILRRVARPDNLFVVGDVNQSIYRFRLAEPRLFLETYERYEQHDGGRLIALNRNFRSRARILDFVNAVFERAMAMPFSEAVYGETAHMRAGATFEDADEDIELALMTDDAALADDDSGADREGAWIARRINRLVGAQFYDAKKGARRALAFRDIVILARTRAPFLAIVRRLRAAGIPCYADQTQGYWDALEVKTALALFQTVENRRRDMALLGVLRSAAGNCTSTELALLRARHPDGTLSDAMRAEIDANGQLAGKLQSLETMLDRFRVMSRALPLAEFGDRALHESGLYAHSTALPGGANRQANLELLLYYMAQFDQTQLGGLTGFLDYAAEIRETGGDSGEARALSASDDVVRLMTAHKSKGLEFPVVFCAGLGRRFGAGAGRDALRVHRTLGAGLKHFDPQLGAVRDTLSRRAIQVALSREELNEELRILYVMTTRAQHKLLLTGCAGRSREQADTRFLIAGKGAVTPESYLDVLAPIALSRPGVRVQWPDDLDGPTAPDRQHARMVAEPTQSNAVRDALTWRYPYEDEAYQPVKLTASGLTRALTSPRIAPPITRRPRFMMEDMTAAERGVQMHAALCAIDIGALDSLVGPALTQAVRDQCARLIQLGVLAQAVDEGVLARFFESALGRRMRAAKQLYREWPFVMRMTMQEARVSDLEAPILVQGVIDMCFLEDGAWVLADFKTDRTPDDERTIGLYREQLRVYRNALTRITGKPVKQALLVMLMQDRAIDLTAQLNEAE